MADETDFSNLDTDIENIGKFANDPAGTITPRFGAPYPNLRQIILDLAGQDIGDSAAALINQKLNEKAEKIPPLKPAVYTNAIRNRFNGSGFLGAPATPSALAPSFGLAFEQQAYDNFGQPAVARMTDSVSAATANQPRFYVPISVADLALAGLTPSDSAPPLFSVRAAIQRATLLNQDIDGSDGSKGHWYVIARYAGAGAALTGALDSANDVIWLGTNTTPSNIAQGNGDAVWSGSTGNNILTANEKILIRNAVPLRATYNGKALSGIILIFYGNAAAAGATAFSVGRMALVPGATVDQNSRYFNTPEDEVFYVGQGNLSPALAALITGAATEASVASRLASNLTSAKAAARAPMTRRPINRLPLDVDYATSLDMRTAGYAVVDLAAQTDLVERGYTKGIQWNISNNNYARWQSGVSQAGKYVFGCMLLYSTNAANLPDVTALTGATCATLFTATTGGALTQINPNTYGGIKLTNNCVLLWAMGQVGAGVTDPNLLIGRPAVPADPTTLFVTGFNLFTSDTAFEIGGDDLAFGTLIQDHTRREIMARVDKKLTDAATTTYTSYPNAFAYGDYVGGTPNLRSNSVTVTFASTNPLYKLGFKKGFNAKTPNPSGGTNEYFRLATGADISNKYFVSMFLFQSDTLTSLPIQQFTENTSNALTTLTATSSGVVSLGNGVYLQWVAGHPGTLANTQNYLFGILTLPATDTYVTGAYTYMSDTAPDATKVIEAYRYRLAVMQDAVARINDVPSVPTTTGQALLVLGGAGYNVRSYVESSLADFTLRRRFDPFNTVAAPNQIRWLFNPREDIINGVTVRSPGDDATPDHIYGTTLGANHGYTTGELTVTGHGKTSADIGSVWATGGNQYTLVGIKDANTLILTRRADNAAVPSATYTNVSGGTNTASFTSTATVAGQWYPPAQDMTMRVLVDGQQVSYSKNGALVSGSFTGSFYYRDCVQFIEMYDIIAKSELIAWIEANGSAAVYPTGKVSSLRVTNVYEYDRYAQLTVYRDWLFLQSVDVQDLMGLQLEMLNAADPTTSQYYIPNTKAFTYNGNSVNYSLIQSANLTIAASGQPSVFFDTTNIETTGPYLERALALYNAGYVDAAGFLPLADVAPAVRKTRVATKAMEIRGNTGKRYFRVVDKGSFTAVAGDHFSAVGYRHVFPKSTKRTAYYTVRSREADYIHVDWHNFTGIDTLDLSEEMIGRTFTVYASRNATPKADILAGSLSVSVAATGDYAFLILRVAK